MLRIPVGREQIHGDLAEWLFWLGGNDIDFRVHRCSAGPSEARNEIAEEFLKSDKPYLWMVDSDTIPPRSLSLLDNECDVVGGWYYQYNPVVRPEPFPCVYKRTSKGYVGLSPKEWKKEPFPVDAVGSGCMLVSRRTLEELPEPFLYGRKDGRRIGEDITFCHRTKREIFVDPRYHCVHHRICNLDEVTARMKVLKYGR